MKPKQIKLEPVGDNIFISIEQANLGALDTSSVKTGVEWGVIKALGPDVQNKTLKVGDRIFVKAWACDTILYDNVDYYFTSESRHGICAILK